MTVPSRSGVLDDPLRSRRLERVCQTRKNRKRPGKAARACARTDDVRTVARAEARQERSPVTPKSAQLAMSSHLSCYLAQYGGRDDKRLPSANAPLACKYNDGCLYAIRS